MSEVESTSETPVTAETPSENPPLPELITNFITFFYSHVLKNNVQEIHVIYETSFNQITDRLYQNSKWPSVETIAHLVNQNKKLEFQLLYSELYYRHIYSKLQPTIEDRIGSWNNYSQLFSLLLDAESPVDVLLPDQWLWDMIDEYIYQFQSFHMAKLKSKKPNEIRLLKANPDLWSPITVISFLERFIEKSQVVAQLNASSDGSEFDKKTEFTQHATYYMLGYYSIIGLLRVNCLLGDYHVALTTLDPLDLPKTAASRGLFTKVTACHVTLYYYLGFVYMILRRYSDAIRTFSGILLFVSRTERHHTRSYQYEEILKKTDQMYALLAICLTLSPLSIDENVQQVLREKFSDKLLALSQGDEKAFEELFLFSCPKFINPAVPTYVESKPPKEANYGSKSQLKLFLHEIRQQTKLSTIRSYLKLYTTIPLSKLAKFLNVDENTLRTDLLCFSHKTHFANSNSGIVLPGTQSSSPSIHFYIDNDMIHISDYQQPPRYGKYFVSLLDKFDDITNKLESADYF